MIDRIRSWFRRKPAVVPAADERRSNADKYASAGPGAMLKAQREAEQRQSDAFMESVRDSFTRIKVWKPAVPGQAMDAKDPLTTLQSAMDSGETGLPSFKEIAIQAGSQLALMPWYMRQGFLGYQNVAFIAQHWLIYKACSVPVDDAIRNGYDITTDTGEDLPKDALNIIKRFDRKIGIKGVMRDFGTKGRIFGIRIAMFDVQSEDDNYYEKPFNPDGVKPGKYKGISQIDPYWCAPILDLSSAAMPSSRHFYEPTWWLIGSRRVHRSHLVIFKYYDPPDVLKPLYLFGGVPLPQMIMERVYAAERTANEAPALALSKRTTVWLTDMSKVMADPQKAQDLLQQWSWYRDNFGVKLGDKDGDQFDQYDTPLGDFDQLIMTQYGLVAATAGTPITKMLGTTPGGFAATGDYDESSYHETLESMQEKDFTPLLERHHLLTMRSEVIPKFKELADTDIVVKWHELDALTHIEQAAVNLSKAQTGAALIASGAIDAQIEHDRVAGDKESGYHGIGDAIDVEELPPANQDDAALAADASGPARKAEGAAVAREQTGGRTKGVLNGGKAA